MSEQLSSPTRKTTSQTFVAGKPKHSTRHLLIANRIRDVIGDYGDLAQGGRKPRFMKLSMLPPLTTAYRQTRDLRQAEMIRTQLEREIVKCEMNDTERQRLVEEILGKCEVLEKMYDKSEKAYAMLQKKQRTLDQITRAAAKEEKAHSMAVKRYLKAGQSLVKLREIMRDVIAQNKCYYDFMEEASGGSGIRSIGQIWARYENCESIGKTLDQRMNESLERAEALKADLFMKKEQWELEQSFEVARLQTLNRELAFSVSMNARFENILTNANVESVAHVSQLNRILESAQQMIENLIQRKVIGKGFRKKTLAQQIEVIRQDYVKRKAVIHEYEKGKDMIDHKRSKRLELYNEFAKSNLVSLNHARTLKDLWEHKRMKAIARRYRRYMKLKKKFRVVADNEEEEVYDPLMDKENIFKMIVCRRYSSFYDQEDEESSEDDGDGIDLATFSETEQFNSYLNSSDRSSFISPNFEHATVGRGRSLAFSRAISTRAVSTGASSTGSTSNYSLGSGGSFSNTSTVRKSNVFMKPGREISWG